MFGRLKTKWQFVLFIFLSILALSILTILKLKKTEFSPIVSDNTREEVVITGMLAIIRNGETKYQLTDSYGKAYELILNEGMLKDIGGALPLDRKKVTISGKVDSQDENKVVVSSIRIEED